MKNIILPVLTIILTVSAIGVNAQDAPAPPPVPDAPVLRDDNIRLRSVEMERARRDAAKKDTDPNAATVNSEIEKKYPEIKEDYEGMQLSQMAIVKAYTMSENIDYKAINASADKINKHAKRLNSNLFSSDPQKKKDKDDDEEKEEKSVRDLIVALDNAIGAVASSKMFQNLRVVDPEVANKTQADLMSVMKISSELAEAAGKMQ